MCYFHKVSVSYPVKVVFEDFDWNEESANDLDLNESLKVILKF